MVNDAHLDRKGKLKAVEIEFDPEQRRVMRIVRGQPRLKNAKIRLVLMIYPAKSGNVAALNQ